MIEETFLEANFSEEKNSKFFIVLTHFPLVIIVIGVVCNFASFTIFRFHREFKTMSSMVYLSFVAITDTLSLFGWNLDHYLRHNHNIIIDRIDKTTCRISSFNQYFSLQASALLLSVLCIDRYVSVASYPGSFYSRLPFRTVRSAFLWSIFIILFTALLNVHILLFAGVYIDRHVRNSLNNQIEIKKVLECYCYENGFKIYPTWERIHMIIYNLIPFVIMVVFNSLLIKNILSNMKIIKKKSKFYRKKITVTISLITVTFLFLLMTLPTTIIFCFFFNYLHLKFGLTFIYIFDSISFLNHAFLFFICLITNIKFRKIVLNSFWKCCRVKNDSVLYLNATTI